MVQPWMESFPRHNAFVREDHGRICFLFLAMLFMCRMKKVHGAAAAMESFQGLQKQQTQTEREREREGAQPFSLGREGHISVIT